MKFLASFVAIAVAASLGAVSAHASDIEGPAPYGPEGYGPQGYAPRLYGALPPYEVITIVRSMGFSPQSRPVLRGRVYVIQAVDNQGIPLRVAVDAGSGRVVRVVERMPGAGYGPLQADRYGAYPVPPSAVPGSQVYEEGDDGGPEYRGPDYRSPNYRAPGAYPQPIYPRSSSQQPAVQQPRVASRTPPATPTPKSRPPAAPATQSATVQPQGSPTQPKGSTAPSVKDSSRPGISIPAPVASRKIATPPEETVAAKSDMIKPDAAKPDAAKPDASAKPADTSLVPVAPLE